MIKTFQRGFTLIELLVVIAIIGILAAVVLASLNDARSGGTNASIQQTTNNIRSQAEIFYNAQIPPSYVNVCADADIVNLMNAVNAASTGITSVNADLAVAGTGSSITCHVDVAGTGYAVSTPLLQTGAAQTHYCVDSTGYAGVSSSTLPASDITCL